MDELSKAELFTRLKDKSTSTAHDEVCPPPAATPAASFLGGRPEQPPPAPALLYLPSAAQVVYRTSKSGRQLAIPQAERYAGRDWAHILWATPNSVVLRRIRNPLLWNVAWSLVVAVVQTRLNVCSRKLASVHGLLGSALGLLLVFRTNAAYQVSRVCWERKDSKGKEHV